MKSNYLKFSPAEHEGHYVQLLIFVCLGFLLYLKSFGYDWTYDDYFVVLDNKDITSIKEFIKNSYPGRPLRELSLMLDYKFFGFSPKFWHFQNLFIHSLNAWLVYVLLMNLSRSKSLSWMSSLIFLVHPIHVEVVAQASHRKDSLCLLFILISFYSYVIFRNGKSKRYIILSIFSFYLSILSKQSSLVFPAFIIIYELFFIENIFFKSKAIRNTFITLSAFISIAVYSVLYEKYFDYGARNLMSYSNVIEGYTVGKYFITLLSSWGFIFQKLFWPVGLSVNYMIAPPESLYDHRLMFLLFFAALVSITLFYAYKKSSLLLLFTLWFLVFLLPTSNIIPFAFHFVADRYLYIPSVGFCFAVAFFLKSFFPKAHTVIALFIVTVFSLISLNQMDVWKDNLSLWENSLEYNPKSARAIMNVALFKYSDNNQLFLKTTLEAIDVNPYDPLPYNSLGAFYYKNNDVNNSILNYEKFIEIMDKKNVGMYKNFYSRAKKRISELKNDDNAHD